VSSGKKTTDLERLTQPGGPVRPDDDTIPVLTERLTLPSLELDISLPPGSVPEPDRPTAPARTPEPREKAAAPAAAVVVSPPASPPPAPPIDWAAVEQNARETLLRELQPRLAAELDRQLRERLQPTLVRMLLATVAELRPSIEAAVRDAVSRAIAAEIARQRSGK
jgi:hypothetical protein